jgi:hypothetical protein
MKNFVCKVGVLHFKVTIVIIHILLVEKQSISKGSYAVVLSLELIIFRPLSL